MNLTERQVARVLRPWLVAVVLVLAVSWCPLSARAAFLGAVRDRVDVGGQPFTVYYMRTKPVIAVQNARGYVTFLDRWTHEEITRTRRFSNANTEATVTPDERYLLTWCPDGSNLHIVSLETLCHVGKVRVGKNLGSVAPLPDGRHVLVTAVDSRTASLVDLDTQEVVRRYRFPRAIGHVALSPAGDSAAATGGVYSLGSSTSRARGSEVFLFSPDDPDHVEPQEALSLDSGRHPRGAVYARHGGWLLTANRLSDSVSVTDPRRGLIVAQLDVGRHPEVLVLHPSRDEAVVINRGDDALSIVDMAAEVRPYVLRTVHLSGKPYAARFLGAGDTLAVAMLGKPVLTSTSLQVQRFRFRRKYVSGERAEADHVGDAVAFVDTALGREQDVVLVDDGPVDIAVSPDGREIAVACATAGTVNFIE